MGVAWLSAAQISQLQGGAGASGAGRAAAAGGISSDSECARSGVLSKLSLPFLLCLPGFLVGVNSGRGELRKLLAGLFLPWDISPLGLDSQYKVGLAEDL